MEPSEDRRQEIRCAPTGGVRFSYNSASVEGELGDISAGGLLGVVKTVDGYPALLETVSVEVRLDAMSVAGLEGLVIRLQAGEALRNSEYVKVAIKFDGLTPEKTAELRTFVIMFQRQRKEGS